MLKRLVYNLKQKNNPFVFMFAVALFSFVLMCIFFIVTLNAETFDAQRAEITGIRLNEAIDSGVISFDHEGTNSWVMCDYRHARVLRVGDPLRVYYSELFDWYRISNSTFAGSFILSASFFLVCGIVSLFVYQPLPK